MQPADRAAAAPVLLAAGGTGGHLFPAEALASALPGAASRFISQRIVGRRAMAAPSPTTRFTSSPARRCADEIRSRSAGQRRLLGFGLLQALALVGRLRPVAVIGFGGYPTIPPVLAAGWRGVPSLIHDANAVIGRANRLLAPRVSAIATTFPDVFRNDPALAGKATLTGNPVRPAVVEAAATPYPAEPERLRLLVFGGSQGARIMAEVVPPRNWARWRRACAAGLAIVQQAREEDLLRVREAYAGLSVAAEVAPFFSDLPARIAASHLVVSRSGASTVAELAAIGRPGILVPLPHALDQDQFANAGVLERAGGAVRITQDAFTPQRLAAEIAGLAAAPARLQAMAAAAQSIGRLDAADRLADLVLKVASRDATK